MIRVTRCHKAEEKTKQEEGNSIPVFVVIATKFIKLTESVSKAKIIILTILI